MKIKYVQVYMVASDTTCGKIKNGNEKCKNEIVSSEKNCEELRVPSPWLSVNERRFCKIEGRVLCCINRCRRHRMMVSISLGLRLWQRLSLRMRLRLWRRCSGQWNVSWVWCLSTAFLPNSKQNHSYEYGHSDHGRWWRELPVVSGERFLDIV